MNNQNKLIIVGGKDVDSRIELIDNLKYKYEIIVIGSSKNIKNKFLDHKIKFYYNYFDEGVNIISDIRAILNYIKIFKKEKPLITHAFDSKVSILSRIAALLSGVKIVGCTITGLGFLYTDNSIITKIERIIYEIFQKVLITFSDYVVFQNNDDYNEYKNRKVINKNKAYLILGSGVKIYDEKIYNGNKNQVIMVSRIKKSKGVLDYIKIAEAFKNNIKFTLVGPIERGTRDSLSENQIVYMKKTLDYISENDNIRELMTDCKIFILLTTYREGIPRVFLEAAEMGKPLIGYDVPGVREIIRNNINGFLVEQKNIKSVISKIRDLIDRDDEIVKMGIESKNMVKQFFDIKIISRKYIDMWDNVKIKKSFYHT